MEYTACAICFLCVQIQCTRHVQGSYHMECTASALSVFCPDTVHMRTYSAGPLPYGFSECTRPIQGSYHMDCKAMGFLSREYTHHIQGSYHMDCKAMGFLSREYTHHIQGSYHME